MGQDIESIFAQSIAEESSGTVEKRVTTCENDRPWSRLIDGVSESIEIGTDGFLRAAVIGKPG
jgi:hypothetical protein